MSNIFTERIRVSDFGSGPGLYTERGGSKVVLLAKGGRFYSRDESGALKERSADMVLLYIEMLWNLHTDDTEDKDEGGRFGLKSFKALGGAYAVCRLLHHATDGNHERSLAWGAQLFGCRA